MKAASPPGNTFARGIFVERNRDHNGIPIWRANAYPTLDSR